jgi:hypothetical protein
LLSSTGRGLNSLAWPSRPQPQWCGGWLCAAIKPQLRDLTSGLHRQTSHRQNSLLFTPHHRTSQCQASAGPGPAGPARQMAFYQRRKVNVGFPRAGVPWPQDFGSTFPHQGSLGFLGDGQLLQEIPAQHHLHAATTHRRAAWRQEGVGEAGVVSRNGDHLQSSKASSAECHLSGPTPVGARCTHIALLLTGNCLPVTREPGISFICWMDAVLPSSWTTSRSSMPIQGCMTHR